MSLRRSWNRRLMRVNEQRTWATDFNRCAQMDNQRSSGYLRALRGLSEGQGAAFAIRSCADGTLTQRAVLFRQNQVSLGWSRTLSLQPALTQRAVLFRRNQVSPGRSRTLSLHPALTQREVLTDGHCLRCKQKGKPTFPLRCWCTYPFSVLVFMISSFCIL